MPEATTAPKEEIDFAAGEVRITIKESSPAKIVFCVDGKDRHTVNSNAVYDELIRLCAQNGVHRPGSSGQPLFYTVNRDGSETPRSYGDKGDHLTRAEFTFIGIV